MGEFGLNYRSKKESTLIFCIIFVKFTIRFRHTAYQCSPLELRLLKCALATLLYLCFVYAGHASDFPWARFTSQLLNATRRWKANTFTT